MTHAPAHWKRPRMLGLGAAVLAGITGAAHADPDRTLHLAVHGSLDSAVVQSALAAELGVKVIVVDGACNVPCLDVAVDGKHTATILFSPRSGQPRSRSVALGNDTSQWPLVITLLAGNVVRDEAQDVLAGLPDDLAAPAADAAGDVPPVPEAAPPPAVIVVAAPVAPPPPEPEATEHSFLAFGLVPGVSTDLTHVGTVRHALSVDLLVGVSGGSSGLSVSGVADIERGVTSGAQIGGVATVARRVAGTQVAGVAAVAGDVDGVQVAGAAAVAGRMDGVQVAGVASVARGHAATQAAGVASFAGDGVDTQVAGVASVTAGNAGFQAGGVAVAAHGKAGVQIAGVASVAGSAEFQAAGVANVAHGPANIQIAGVVNVAGRVHGLQLAPVNIAHGVDGVQVGVVNVGGSVDGFSFGLINIVPGGRYDLETAIDSSKTATLLFRHGGRRWHNVYGVAGHPVSDKDSSRSGNDDVWMYGLGFGPSMEFNDTVVDLEAIAWQVNHGPSHERDFSLLTQARLSVEHHWGAFGIVAGLVYNTYITDDHMSPLILERRATQGSSGSTGSGVTVERWPSAFIGVRI